MRTKIISVVNQKGGTAKTTTVLNLGIGLANHGYRVLLIDLDPQGSLTVCLGHDFPDELNNTITDLLEGIKDESPISCETVIRKHEEGVDYIPGNITLSGLEVSLVNTMNRERILQQLLQQIANGYDYILIDCMPSLGMLTLNALVASNEVIVPVQANYLSIKGLEQLFKTIKKVKRQLNHELNIEGILVTMLDCRTTYAKEITERIRKIYGDVVPVFKTEIPRSVRVEETATEGKSIFAYDAKGKVADAYKRLVLEVKEDGKERI